MRPISAEYDPDWIESGRLEVVLDDFVVGVLFRGRVAWTDAAVLQSPSELGAPQMVVQEEYTMDRSNRMGFSEAPMLRRTAIPVGLLDSHTSAAIELSSVSLSQRERTIVLLMGHGLSNKRIARELSIGPETVKTHAKHIFWKLAVQSRAQAVYRASTLGLI